MKTMPSLIREITGSDKKLCEQAMKIYAGLFESYEWTEHEIEQYGGHLKKNADAYAKSGRNDTITYDNGDENPYNDEEGARWVETKKRDDHTLWLAYIDGVIDTMPSTDPNYEKLKAAYEHGDVEEAKKYFDAENANITIEFLKKHRHGTTTVYRGAILSKDEISGVPKDADWETSMSAFSKIPENKVREILLKSMSNTSKRFSSFSTDPNVSMKFATPRCYGISWLFMHANMDQLPVLIAAEAEPNDINFAFTAYLGGRHKNYNWEHELNINNIKELQNVRIIFSNTREKIGQLHVKTVHSRALNYALFRVNSGMPVKEVYDNAVPLSKTSTLVSKDGACNLLHRDTNGDYSYLLQQNSFCAIPQPNFGNAICYFRDANDEISAKAISPEGNTLNTRDYCAIDPFNDRGYAKVTGYIEKPYNEGYTVIDSNFNEITKTLLPSKECDVFLLDDGTQADPVAVVDSHQLNGKPFFIMPDGTFKQSDEAQGALEKIQAAHTEQAKRHEESKQRIRDHKAASSAPASAIEKFTDAVIGDDQELHESVDAIYRGIFENSATDINVKQIAAQPGTCQQGIVPNENLANDKEPPENETVAALMQNSYASRFGRGAGPVVNPGRTSLGMWGGTGPQNVNASTDAPAS